MKTIRNQIADALVGDLAADAWVTVNALSVNPGKTLYTPDELPAISIFIDDETSEKAYGRQNSSTTVQVKYIGLVDETIPVFDQIEQTRGEIIRAVCASALGGLAGPADHAGDSIAYPAPGEQDFSVTVFFRIDYETILRNPFAQ